MHHHCGSISSETSATKQGLVCHRVVCSLRFVHNVRAGCARRLMHAIMENEPITKEIFRPDEIIFNPTMVCRNDHTDRFHPLLLQ